MSKRSIKVQLHFSSVEKPTIRVEHYWWEPEPVNPTMMELATCPKLFRCFVCDRKKHQEPEKGHDNLGGFLADETVCRICYPWVDADTIRCLRRFDHRRDKPQYGSPKVPRPEPPDIPEEILPTYLGLCRMGMEIPESEQMRQKIAQQRREIEKHFGQPGHELPPMLGWGKFHY